MHTLGFKQNTTTLYDRYIVVQPHTRWTDVCQYIPMAVHLREYRVVARLSRFPPSAMTGFARRRTRHTRPIIARVYVLCLYAQGDTHHAQAPSSRAHRSRYQNGIIVDGWIWMWGGYKFNSFASRACDLVERTINTFDVFERARADESHALADVW